MRLFLLALVFSVYPLSVLSASQCELGIESDDTAAFPVSYKASLKVRYSDSPPKPFSAIVFHDPGSNNCDPLAMVHYGQTYDKKREGMFGYHFYIAQDGTVYQGAPLKKRTNHVAGQGRRTTLKYSNASAIGISLMCGHKKIPEAQLQAAVRLGHLLQVAYGIPSSRIFGHGELQYNRMPNEGLIAARATRTTSALPDDAIDVYKDAHVHTRCSVRGIVPTPCAAQSCEVFAQTQSLEYIAGIPAGLYKILEGNTGYSLASNMQNITKIPVPTTRFGIGPRFISGKEIDTDAHAWGYGEHKAASKTGKDATAHFGNPLESFSQ